MHLRGKAPCTRAVLACPAASLADVDGTFKPLSKTRIVFAGVAPCSTTSPALVKIHGQVQCIQTLISIFNIRLLKVNMMEKIMHITSSNDADYVSNDAD